MNKPLGRIGQGIEALFGESERDTAISQLDVFQLRHVCDSGLYCVLSSCNGITMGS